MEREVGGGIGMGNTCKPLAVSFQCMTKSTTNKKIKKINKRHLLLGRKFMTNLDSILKSKDITLPTKVCLVNAVVFPVVMYGCESWTVKKPEGRKMDAFELWCWRRLLRFPWRSTVHPEGDKSWVFIGRTDAEVEIPILWPPHVKS